MIDCGGMERKREKGKEGKRGEKKRHTQEEFNMIVRVEKGTTKGQGII